MVKSLTRRDFLEKSSKTAILASVMALGLDSLTGCAPLKKTIPRTVPNASIIESSYVPNRTEDIYNFKIAKGLLSELSENNYLLASELGKIPELRDGVTLDEVGALRNIIHIRGQNRDEFDKAFSMMNSEGIPEVRKYCVPLQAMFWLAEQNRVEEIKSQLGNYSENIILFGQTPLEQLLGRAWDFLDKAKWRNPQEIMDRLNSPELFEYWFKYNFDINWAKTQVIVRTAAWPQSPEKSLRSKKGVSYDAAYLAYVCLKRAGYYVTGLNVYYKQRTPEGYTMHSVCVVKMEQYHIIGDIGTPGGHISAPFESIRDVAEYIALYHGVSLGRYTTGLPYHDPRLFPGG